MNQGTNSAQVKTNVQSSALQPTLKDRASNMVSKMRGDNFLLTILFGIFIFVLVYLLILYNKPTLLNYTLSNNPTKMNKDSINSLPNTSKLPSLRNGREYAYSFWVFLESIQNHDNYRLVFLRTPSTGGNYLQNANPIVYLDKNSNAMIIKLRTSEADKDAVNAQHLDEPIIDVGTADEKTFHQDNCKYSTFKIDYVPLQRWVNVIINVDNQSVAVMMDGSIHSTRVLNENNMECDNDLSKVVSPTNGDVMVGNINETTNTLPAANGYLSRVQFFNYSLKTPAHIERIYEAGPVKSIGILQKLGLPLYGLRNPLYRVDEVKVNDLK